LAGCGGAWTCCSSTAPPQIFRINLKFSPSRQERQHCHSDIARHRPAPGSSGARRAVHATGGGRRERGQREVQVRERNHSSTATPSRGASLAPGH
jgi:hypothetical protein